MKQINLLITISLFSVFFIGCIDADDQYTEFIKKGEIIYLSKTDSLIVIPGFNRAELKWYVSADPKIESTVIYWNMREDSLVKPFNRVNRGVQPDSTVIEKLSEGICDFEFINKNSYGLRSLVSEIRTTIFGKNYQASLQNRPISSMEVISYDKKTGSSTVTIKWGSNPKEAIGIELSYKERSTGSEKTIMLFENEQSVTITDVGNRINNVEDFINIKTLFHPNGSLDTIPSLAKREQVCIYSVSGKRTEYDSNGSVVETVEYDNILKRLRRINDDKNNLSTDIYECDRIANYEPSTNSMFRIAFGESKKLEATGYFQLIENRLATIDENSIWIPESQKLILEYSITKANGKYSIVKEEYIPSNVDVISDSD